MAAHYYVGIQRVVLSRETDDAFSTDDASSWYVLLVGWGWLGCPTLPYPPFIPHPPGQAKERGVIFKMMVTTGVDVAPYSFIERESEILLSPNTRFMVTRELYRGDDGYSYVDLTESHGTLLRS